MSKGQVYKNKSQENHWSLPAQEVENLYDCLLYDFFVSETIL
jgi:hypothetical protein